MTTTIADAGRPTAPTNSRVRPKKRERRSTALTIIMWLSVLYFVLPITWLLIASTKDNADLFSSFGFAFGDRISLWDNLVNVFTVQGGVYLRWTLNTLLYSTVSAAGAMLLSALAGYGFAKFDFPGKKVLFSVTLGAIMIPMTALALPTYVLFSNAGLTNTYLAIIIPSLVSPFGVYLMRVYAAEAIPDTLIEAARVDGASEARIFWQVAVRLLGPAMVTVFLFSFVGTWNNYFLPLIMLNTSALYPLTVGLAQQMGATAAGGGAEILYSTVITGATVSVIPLLIAFLVLQRYWQVGLATGSVKE